MVSYADEGVSIDIAREVLERVLKRGVDLCIVRMQERLYERVVFDSGSLRSYSVSKTIGIGIRAVVDGGVGYSYTTSLDMDSVERAIDRAISMARIVAKYVRKRFASVAGFKDRYRVVFKVDPFEVDSEVKVKLVEEVNREAMRIEGVVSAVTRLACERDRRIVVTSDGIEVETDIVAVGFSHTAVAKSGAVAESVGDAKTFIGGYEYIEGWDWHSFASEINELAIKASQARTPSPGTYVAVIDNDLVGLLLHEAFGHASEGDGVVVGASVLRNKIGQYVASELVTIVDEGIVAGGYPVPYDDEGIPKKRTIVVENGVLKSYLHSRYTAIELGQEVSGNARAQDISFDAIVRQTNYYLEPRDWRVEELFEDIREGIYLKGRGARGGQVDSSVGTFTFNVGPSYLIKNGEPTELVRGVAVSGNILEVLKDIDAIGRDLKVRTSVFGGCGKGGQMVRVGIGGPHVRVKRIVVGGG